MKLNIVFAIVTGQLLLISQLVLAGSISDTFSAGDSLTATMLTNIKSAVNDNDTNKVIKSGDTMTGSLTVPALNVYGSTSGDVVESIRNANTRGSERLFFGADTGSGAGIIVWGSTNSNYQGKWRF